MMKGKEGGKEGEREGGREGGREEGALTIKTRQHFHRRPAV
jgi:hypothetical protein